MAEDSSVETKPVKLKKFYPFEAGNTKGCHERIIQKLVKYGAKEVNNREKSQVLLVFCPVVSRLETDINAALSEVKLQESSGSPKVIVVAMHHTYKVDYIVPPKTKLSHGEAEVVVVHSLFHETKGLLRCPTNKEAIKTIRKEMGIKKYSDRIPLK